MKRFGPLRGGDSQQENFNTTVFLGIIGILVIMAGLMWGGQIQFATTQDLNLTASILTTTAVLLMFYILYTLTVKANACVAV